MKLSLLAVIPAVLASLALPALRSSALPEPDYPCYAVTRSGRVVDLTSLCSGKVAAVLPTSTYRPGVETVSPRSQAQTGGQVINFERNVSPNGNETWLLSGKVLNQTGQPVSVERVTLNIDTREGGRTEDVTVAQVLNPGETASFQTPINSIAEPKFQVAKVHWSSLRSGICNSPDDIASDGSRCGGRAADQKVGGR